MTKEEEMLRALKEMENWLNLAEEKSRCLYEKYWDSESNHGAALLNDGKAIAYRQVTNQIHNIIKNAER